MEVSRWAGENWFDILSAVGIIGGLFFTALSLRSESKTRKVANLITLTASHREIWKEFYRRPELARVLNPSLDLAGQGVTPAEEEFVKFVILHLSTVYYAMKDELLMKLDGVRRDACAFLSLPLPQAVWERIKAFQNEDFVAFVEECRRGWEHST